jgi:hypothetical protein
MTSDPQWTSPAPPPHGLPFGGGEREPIRARHVWAGIGLATLGHLVSIAVALATTIFGIGEAVFVFGLVLQAVLFVACLTVGTVLLTRQRRRGVGLGLLIGWGVGVIVLPVVGIGACLYVLSTIHTG